MKRRILKKVTKFKVLCSHCNVEIQKNKSSWPPAKSIHFDDRISLDETKGIRKVVKPVKKEQNRNVNLIESENCACCNFCGGRFNKEELLKAAGDRLIDESLKNRNKIVNPQKIKDLFKFINVKNTDNNLKNCRQQKEESPLFEMQLNSELYDIINKDEVIDNITKLSKMRVKDKTELTKSHKKSCRCCICLGKRKRLTPKELMAKNLIPKQLTPKKIDAKKKDAEKKKKKAKPCTCGSFVCSKKSQKMNKDLVKVPVREKRWKPCVCGSPICDRESATMKSLSSRPEEMTCICQEKIKARKLKIRKKEEKQVAERRADIRKKRNAEDRIRRKLRMRRDKEMERKINTKSSDIILAAESLIDIGKLGITACTDILRSVARCTSDPKQAYYTLKSMKEDPEVIMSTLKSAYQDSGVAATAKRVRLRCLSMRGVKRIKNKLEENAVTNFMLHIADNDPRRRVLKKKPAPVRLRERLDYGCSLYMGSLRKRPYLSIYDRWPRFYPHFLSLLNVWKQFTDIMLFLLAVVVWSPCILCMEACRAIMCCFFCTG
ncbi:uncharacterized protein LOC126768609 isoform X2 [Nymphalis io]|uniref:uncharacterized protein LOC126768609 isoform X2 n=1 Tax=Inachis io TaxID=171585 RepID=UPI00216735C5|nr:uncharacterized protein LOC126768609 isoform X2 [Nymphalis io]